MDSRAADPNRALTAAHYGPQIMMVRDTPDSQQTSSTTATPRRIAIVDDDPILREVMAARLREAGYAVTGAGNGEAGGELIDAQHFDLAVIDLGMPKLDGFGLLRRIRENRATADLPVIVATSSDDRDSVDRAYRLGASSFITKPINWAKFSHLVQFVMRAGEIERALRAAQAEALSASKMKNGLFQVLSHELKTPLAALVGLTGVLAGSLKDRVAGEEAEQLDYVVEAAQRLNTIVSDILILSKALAGRDRLSLAPCSLAELLEDSTVGLKTLARQRNIKLAVHIGSNDCLVHCDQQLIRQALRKLIENAVKFSHPGGTVEIWSQAGEDGSQALSVRDHGPGLSAAKLKECLQPFIQDDMSYARPAGGLGLGLPIAQAIAEAHGGELTCETAPGQGMLVTIRLPDRDANESRARSAPRHFP